MNPRVIYQFWTGNNPITTNRIEGLKSAYENLKAPVVFVGPNDLPRYEVPGSPFHPAYPYLSTNHKSDFLRCYFMNFYGGGYADIKYYSKDNNFDKCFDLLDSDPAVEIVGEKEIPNGPSIRAFRSEENLKKMLVCGWFVARKHSSFTETWYSRVCKYLDGVLPELTKHPATEPFGGPGYPVPWTAVMGDIFHQVCFETFNSCPVKMSNMLVSGRLNKPYR